MILTRVVWRFGKGEADPECRVCGRCLAFHTDVGKSEWNAPWWCPGRWI